MRELLRQLGEPQEALHGVLIGGTNGKGSTQAMVASMLLAGGYVTLQSPSPHLSSYRERIIIGGEPISREDLNLVLQETLDASLPSEPRHGLATQFELLTAAAFLWGARRGVDVAVMEVGLGGRLDATNTWDGGVAAITNIGLDHQEYLGDTIAEVAAEKAAIIKSGNRVVSGATGSALEVIKARCVRLDVPLTVTSALHVDGMDTKGLLVRHGRLGQVHIGLLGRVQAQNAGLALGVMDALEGAGIAAVTDAARRDGLAEARWPGRLELLESDEQTVLLDGAHNPDGMTVLAATLDELRPSLPAGRATLLLGVMRDKEIDAMLASLARSTVLADAHLVASGIPDTDRARPAADITSAWARMAGTDAPRTALDDADQALAYALDSAHREGGLLVVAGSLYLVGHVRVRLLPAAHVV